MSINQRLSLFYNWYIADHEISQKEFSKAIGMSPSQLSSIISGRDKVGLNTIEKFLNLNSNIDVNWLITGDGEMFKSKNLGNEETRPRIPIDASAGSPSFGGDGIILSHCEQFPVIKSLPKYDFTIIVYGKSMEPEYSSGDELACRYIKESTFIQWGRIHVIDTAQGVLIKRIFDGGNYIVCQSDNPSYPEFTIPKNEFFSIALVIGMVRRY